MPRVSRCCSKISQRWLTVVIIFVTFLNLYGMRVCLSIAITEMALPHHRTQTFSDATCSRKSDADNSTQTNLKESLHKNIRYDWTEQTQGLILSSFYWGYIFTSIIGGILNQKFGGRRVLGLSVLLASSLTLLTPFCTKSAGPTGLIFLRLAIGIAEGATQPAVSDLLAHWIPHNERSKAGAIAYSCIPLGAIYGMLPSGMILQLSDSGWPMVFYFYGASGLVSFFLIVAFCYSQPSQNPFISDEELSYLNDNLKNIHSNRPSPPWRHILQSLPVWTLIIATIGHNFGFITIMSDMPKYMSSVLKFSVQSNGLFSSIPHLSMWIAGIAMSWAADKLVTAKTMPITAIRKIGCAIAGYGPAVFVVAASYAGCDAVLATALLTVGVACLGAIFFSTSINTLDLSPNYAGTIIGLMSGLSSVFGMLAPYVVGVVTPNQTIAEWRIAFWIVFGVMVGTNTLFLVYGSGEVQEWNDPEFLSKRCTVKERRAMNGNEVKEAVDLLP